MADNQQQAVEFVDKMAEDHRGIVASMNYLAAQTEQFQSNLETGLTKLRGKKSSKNDDFLTRKG